MSVLKTLMSSGLGMAVATAAISGAVFIGLTVSGSDDGFRNYGGLATSAPATGPTTYTGSSVRAAAPRMDFARPVSVSSAHSSFGAASGRSSSASRSSSSALSRSSAQSYLPSSLVGGGSSSSSAGGPGGGDGGSGGGSLSGMGTTTYGGTSGVGSAGYSNFSSGRISFASSSARADAAEAAAVSALAESGSVIAAISAAPSEPFSGPRRDVWTGDGPPGVIPGGTNPDDPIIGSYGQPVGDALLPLLFFAIIFIIYKRKTMLKTVSNISTRSQRNHAGWLTLCLLLMLPCTCAWAGQETVTYKDVLGNDSVVTYNVVYLTVGGTNGDGNSSTTPVNSWANAYKKLPNYTGTTDADRDEAWDHNIIVVQNTTVSSARIQIDETIAKGNGTQGIPATITGVWPWTAENTTATKVKAGGMVTLHSEVDPTSTSSNRPTRIGADTKFKYIRFGGNSNCFLSMYLHDCTFDVGCVMSVTTDLIPSNGALKIGSTTRKAPDMQVFLFANTYSFSTSTTDGGFNALMKKPVTLTIKSGKFGRILSNRITGTTTDYAKKRYVIGNPNNPLLCIVNVDIDPETSTGDWNPRGDVDDIAFLCAGMTQGAEYADVQFNIKRGRITTLVGAMQGNNITVCSQVEPSGLSNSSYFGRTETNILAENDNDVTIYRYYAACFGRMTGSQAGIANVAFYGKSTLNMYGGTIENGAYVSAGGVSGLVSPYNPDDYTNDQYIPYVDNTATYRNYPYMGVKYQPYDSNKEIVHVKSMLYKNAGEEPEDIDLSKTVTAMNIYGGVVRGGVFGGSYGYSTELVVTYAMPKAGSLWGETNVNIYGGHIYGGVYGGGEGSSNYYNLATAENRDKFSTVATVYGNTNVNIYGGTIEGGIFGGGKGLEAQAAGKKVTITTTNGTDPVTKDITTVANEFLDIAKVYGNTNVTIDPRMPGDFETKNPDWTFTGNIYGGGALGSVEGDTNVNILGGTINGNVYGGGKGEEGHPDKAKVTGTTNVTVGEEATK